MYRIINNNYNLKNIYHHQKNNFNTICTSFHVVVLPFIFAFLVQHKFMSVLNGKKQQHMQQFTEQYKHQLFNNVIQKCTQSTKVL